MEVRSEEGRPVWDSLNFTYSSHVLATIRNLRINRTFLGSIAKHATGWP